MFQILTFLTPVVSFFLNLVYRNQKEKQDKLAAWKRAIENLNARTNSAVDSSLTYDQLVREQDERLKKESSQKE